MVGGLLCCAGHAAMARSCGVGGSWLPVRDVPPATSAGALPTQPSGAPDPAGCGAGAGSTTAAPKPGRVLGQTVPTACWLWGSNVRWLLLLATPPTGPWWSALGSASQGFTDWLLIHRSEESLCYAFSSHRRHQVLAGTRRWCTDLEGHLVKSWKPLVHAAGVGSWDRPRLAATIPGTPSTCVAALSAP